MKTMRGLTTAFSLIAVLCLFGCSGNGVHDAGDEEQEDANLQPAFVLKSIDAHATIHDGSAVNVVQNIATMELDDRGNVIRAVYRNQEAAPISWSSSRSSMRGVFQSDESLRRSCQTKLQVPS